jgi:hypothetical protein
MHIDWSALGLVVVVALASVAVLTTLFAFGTRSLSNRVVAGEQGAAGAWGWPSPWCATPRARWSSHSGST